MYHNRCSTVHSFDENYKNSFIKKEASPIKIVSLSQIIGNKRPGEKHPLFVIHTKNSKVNPCSPSVSKNWEMQVQINKGFCIWKLLTAAVCHRCQSGKHQATPHHDVVPVSSDLVNKHQAENNLLHLFVCELPWIYCIDLLPTWGRKETTLF